MNLDLVGVDLAAPDGAPLIRAATLAIAEGVTALIGGNGAGKSTLLRAIFGLHPLSAGMIRFGDYDHRRDRRAFLTHAAFVP